MLYDKMRLMPEKAHYASLLQQLRSMTPPDVMVEVEMEYDGLSMTKHDVLQEVLAKQNRKDITESYLVDLKKNYIQIFQHYQLVKTKYKTFLRDALYYSEIRNTILHGKSRISPVFDEYLQNKSLLRHFPKFGINLVI